MNLCQINIAYFWSGANHETDFMFIYYHLIYILINFYGTYHLRLAENELNNHSGTSNSALGGLSLKLTSHLMNKILFRKYQLRQGSFIGSLTHFLL